MNYNRRVWLLGGLASLCVLASGPAPTRPRGWVELLPRGQPIETAGHGLAFDSRRGVVVKFGGSDQQGRANAETWEMDLRTQQWVQRFPAHVPVAREGPRLAYDAARGVVVLFGGISQGRERFDDTWLWDGQDWTEVLPAHRPAPRYAHGQVYDDRRQVVVVFGGLGFEEHNDLWQWDGQDWSERPAGTRPRRRSSMGLAYDSRRDALVVFGGLGNTLSGAPATIYGDTWEWLADRWVQRHPAHQPAARSHLGLAYSPTGGYTLLFGGQLDDAGIEDDTWLWDGVNWYTTTPPVRPPGRNASPLVYVPQLRALVLVSGLASDFYTRLNDTWAFFDVR